MADWYGTSRSNYFRVKDEAAFREWADRRGLGVFETDEAPLLFAIHGSDSGYGSWPYYDVDEDTEFDLAAELSTHLMRGQIAILMECGADNLRYMTGFAIAVNHRGRKVGIDIDDIYRKAARTFRVPETSITRAAY